MNFNRSEWQVQNMNIGKTGKINHVFSNINHPWFEFLNCGPYGVKLRNMAEANQASLRLYRQACRFVPTLLNRTTTLHANDYHMSKRILGVWFRRGKNMKDLSEITKIHKSSQDFLIDAAYGNIDSGDYNVYLHKLPKTKDNSIQAFTKLKGFDMEYFRKYANKTRFFEKFIKGSRSLLK